MKDQKHIREHLSKKNEILSTIIKECPTYSIDSTNNVFHDLMSCLIEQQIHYRSTKKIFQKAFDQSSLKELTVDNFELFEPFAFAKMKPSDKKTESIYGVINYFKNHDFNWSELSQEECMSKLKSISGIGPWTIQMIMIYTLGFKDVFPTKDYHMEKVMVTKFGLDPNTKFQRQIRELTEDWSPYRSHAFLYILEWKRKWM